MTTAYGRPAAATKGRRRPPVWLAQVWLAPVRLASVALLAITGAVVHQGGSAMADTPRTVRIMALGDSLTAGYGLPHADGFVAVLQAALDRQGAHATVLDAGVSGDTSQDGLARLDWALGDRPDAAIVELGANDGLRGLPPDAMEHNLGTILDRLRNRHIPVLLAGMYAPPNLGSAYFTAFRTVFDRLSKRPGLLFYPFFLDGVAGDRSLNQPDGVHPSAAGVRIIVGRILPSVTALVAKARGGRTAGQG